MTYYPDLGTSTLITSGSHIRAIGWLEKEHPFPKGETPPAVRSRLAEFAKGWSLSARACRWPAFAGLYRCSLCGCIGYGEFAVPGKEVLYVAPYLISHYVDAHGYCPPAEFIEAVLQCPSFETAEYTESVARFPVDLGKGWQF